MSDNERGATTSLVAIVNERTPVPLRCPPLVAVVLAAIAAIGVLLASPATVLAENTVVSSTPADGSSIASSPPSIQITFSEPLGEVNTIAVQCDAELYTVGPRNVSEDRLTLSADLVDPLPASDCVVSWGVSDADGQPNGAGNLTFIVQNDTAVVETTTPTTEQATMIWPSRRAAPAREPTPRTPAGSRGNSASTDTGPEDALT